MVLSDDDVIIRVKEALEIQYAEGDNASSVTQDITLPVTGQFGLTSITWESDDMEAITIDGKVIRPAKGTDNAEATITATITLGSATQQNKVFTLTILALSPTVPGKPGNVSAMVSGIGEITVSWTTHGSNGGVAITEYMVYWGTSAGFVRETTHSKTIADGTATELAIQNLTPGTDYYFAVTAANSVGKGAASDEVSVMAAEVPDSPTGVSALGTGDGEITVS